MIDFRCLRLANQGVFVKKLNQKHQVHVCVAHPTRKLLKKNSAFVQLSNIDRHTFGGWIKSHAFHQDITVQLNNNPFEATGINVERQADGATSPESLIQTKDKSIVNCPFKKPSINVLNKTFENIPGPNIRGLGDSSFFRYKPFGRWDYNKLHHANLEKFQKYGPIVREKQSIYGINSLLLFDPRDVEKVFRNEGACPYRPSFPALVNHRIKHNYSLGLGQLQGTEWRELRRTVQKRMMNLESALPYLNIQSNTADDLVKLIRHKRSRVTMRIDNFITDLQKWSLESIVAALLGRRLGCLNTNNAENMEIEQLIDDTCRIFEAQYDLMNGIPWWKYFPTKSYHQFVQSHERIFKICKKYTMEVLDIRQNNTNCSHNINSIHDVNSNNSKSSSINFISYLAKEKSLKINDLLTTVIELMISGIQTTASGMAFCLYHLARNPNIQNKLRQEIDKSVGEKGVIDGNIIRDLTYLRAIIWESSRLTPVAFGTVRMLSQPIELSGYQIPAGVPLLIQNMVMSRLPNYFKDHDEFIPERWLKHGSQKEFHPYCVLPYGHGPRMCIGRRFAEQELNLGLIKIIRNFNIEYHDEPMDSYTELIVKPDKPLNITFKDI